MKRICIPSKGEATGENRNVYLARMKKDDKSLVNMSMDKPNILLITVDQMRFDHLGVKGVKGIETPNLNKLCKKGIHFDKAYTPSPVCTPARMSLLTGQYPSRHGAYSIGVTVAPLPEMTVPALLSKSGYRTGLIGKSHFVSRKDEESILRGENQSKDHFDHFTGPYMGFDYVQLSANHTINGYPEWHYESWLKKRGVDYSAWFPDMTGGHDHSQTGVWNIPEDCHDSSWITEMAVEYIRESNDDKPWFLWTSYNDPHEPFVCPEPWFSSVHMGEVELYEDYREGEFEDKPAFYKSVYESEEPQGGWPESFKDETGIASPCAYGRSDLRGKEKEALQATLGMVAMLDDKVGKLIQALEASGQWENTVIIFTSDHGEIHGHHGLWHKGLFAYEDCQKVPMIIAGHEKWIQKRNISSPSLFSLIDIPCTILDYANIEKPQGFQGRSWKNYLEEKDENKAPRDFVIVEMQATHNVYQETFIDQNHKLVIYRDTDYGELYNLKTDPDQYTNLWNVPDSQQLKSRLFHKFLQAKLKEEPHTHKRVAFA